MTPEELVALVDQIGRKESDPFAWEGAKHRKESDDVIGCLKFKKRYYFAVAMSETREYSRSRLRELIISRLIAATNMANPQRS